MKKLLEHALSVKVIILYGSMSLCIEGLPLKIKYDAETMGNGSWRRRDPRPCFLVFTGSTYTDWMKRLVNTKLRV